MNREEILEKIREHRAAIEDLLDTDRYSETTMSLVSRRREMINELTKELG